MNLQVSLTRQLRIALLHLWGLAVATLACSADIGEECDGVGSRDECVDGAVCTNESDGAHCRAVCDDDDDCPADRSCNGVSGTNVKSCQSKNK